MAAGVALVRAGWPVLGALDNAVERDVRGVDDASHGPVPLLVTQGEFVCHRGPAKAAKLIVAGPARQTSERAMHDEQGDLAVLGVAEGAGDASHGDEADPLVQPDRRGVALGDRIGRSMAQKPASRAQLSESSISARPVPAPRQPAATM